MVGSVTELALSGRRPPTTRGHAADAADWWAAVIRLVGTILFTLSTVAALITATTASGSDLAGWSPDVWGSLAFLLSSVLALFAAARRHQLWDPLARTWHGTTFTFIGSVAFVFSAVRTSVIPPSNDALQPAWNGAGTFAGAVFLFIAALLARRFVGAAPD